MSMLRRVLLLVAILFVAAVLSLLALAYGVIPVSGKDQVTLLFGSSPGGMVAEYSAGWEDHKTFLLFKATPDWVYKAAAYAGLHHIGSAQREKCVHAPRAPWWFATGPGETGVCWERMHGYGGGTMLHYNESSGYVYVHDYST